ncbi:MAG: carbonic anhydrase [Deltaproteobacteria bacterium]|nr:carbonic anhydrase [Deltaproteobacteria bacterium]
MKKLIEGVLRFQNEVYPQHRELYQDLATTQSPRWLLITCSDSRVVPSLIAQVGPGEIFICRNVGNIVPAHGEVSGGVAATIEYAVQLLGVLHIVVCGHSDCGAMRAVLHPENVAELPAVTRWIAYADRARAVVLETHPNAPESQKLEVLIQENVLAQLDNLRTLPSVAAKLRAGTLGIHGWTYDIQSGGFLAWDQDRGRWRPVQELAEPSGDAAA